tara:strand:+ start:1550 stop:1747 length:198 start_codon:yes stop_codon:yes gene_type:complete
MGFLRSQIKIALYITGIILYNKYNVNLNYIWKLKLMVKVFEIRVDIKSVDHYNLLCQKARRKAGE